MAMKEDISHFVAKESNKEHICPYCEANTFDVPFAEASWMWEEMSDFAFGKAFGILRCKRCGMNSIVIYDVRGSEADFSSQSDVDKYRYYHPEVVAVRWAPEGGSYGEIVELIKQGQYPCRLAASRSTPFHIEQDLSEACNCLAVGANTAAVIMCRRMIEHIAADKYGYQTVDERSGKRVSIGTFLQNLKRQIDVDEDDVDEDDVDDDDVDDVDKEMLDRLIVAKDLGNFEAHTGRGLVRADSAYAKQVVQFLHNLLLLIYPLPDQYDLDKEHSELKQIRDSLKKKKD